ncbi:hypothetical protein ABW19_dt0203995 [Dactylella cylindrospora]|nr:hypothetical protein ABW19_dt0203995 [Dactylella cylindrospora]
MIRRRCNVLRNRHLVGGALSQCYPRAVQLRAGAVGTRAVSTSTGGSEEGEKETGSETSASASEATSDGKPKKPIFRFIKDKLPPEQREERKRQLQRWVNRRTDPAARGAVPIQPPSILRKESSSTGETDEPPEGLPKSHHLGFKVDQETGDLLPKVQRQLGPQGHAVGVQYTFDETGGTWVRKPLRTDVGVVQKDGETVRTAGIEDLMQTYGTRKQRMVGHWAPDNIEGLDNTTVALRQAERAAIPIDQSLRQKFLKTYSDLPLEQPQESEVDVDLFTEAVLKLPVPKQPEMALPDTSTFHYKLPPAIVRKLERRGLDPVKVDLPKETWASMTPEEALALLNNMFDNSIISESRKIMELVRERRFTLTRDIAEKILSPLGYRSSSARVREFMDVCDSEKIPVSFSHLMRAYRAECRNDPVKLEETIKLVTQMAKNGFDERTYGAIMHLYGDAGRRDLVIALFNNHEKFVNTYPLKHTFIHNSLLWTFNEANMAEEAEYIYHAMKYGRKAPQPDDDSYGLIAQVYSARPDYFRKLLILVKEYIQTGLPFNDEVFGALMKSCASAGRLDIVIAVFNQLMSRPEFRPTKALMTDYIISLMLAKVEPDDEGKIQIGVPIHEKLPVDMEEIDTDVSFSTAKDDQAPGDISKEAPSEGESTAVPLVERLDPKHEKYQIPVAPTTPTTTGELLALADLQYQHIRKYHPGLATKNIQRLFIRLFVSQGYYETFKKAYRYLALATGFRGRQALFPAFRSKVKISFADFAKGAVKETPIRPDERFEFDYLGQPLSQLDVYPALRAAFETKDLEFAKLVLEDYDRLIRDHSDKLNVRAIVRESWQLTAEALAINTLAHCGDIEAAFQRFEAAMDTIAWDADRPRLFAKRVAVFTGVLVRSGLTNMSARVFERLQMTEWEKQVMYRQNAANADRKVHLDPSLV